MLIAKFIMCLFMIAFLTLTSACAGKSGNADDPAQNEASATGAPAQASLTTAKIAALDGTAGNKLEIFTHSPASGDLRTASGTYQISLPGPGTLIIIAAAITSPTCSPDQFSASFALFEVGRDGILTGMQPLALQQPHRVYAQKNLQLQTDLMVKHHCTALSPATFVFALKFIGQSGDDAPGSTTGPLSAVQPPSQPAPGPLPSTPPPAVNCDDAMPPADTPAVYDAQVRLWTSTSKADGCRNTFTWTIRTAVRPDPVNRCAFPEIKLTTPQPQFLKLSEDFADHSRQLAWFLMKNDTDAGRLANALRAGQTVDLTYENDGCRAEHRDYLTISQPSDLLLFRNDARDYDDCGDLSFTALSRAQEADAGGFLASYDYRSAGDDQFFYEAAFSFTGFDAGQDLNASGLSWALFNRRSHAWILPFQDSDARVNEGILSGRIKVTDAAALRRLLPQQEHLELVLRPRTAVCDKTATRSQAVFDAGTLFLSAEGTSHFRDLAHTGRSRFALKEADLPASDF